MRQDISNSELQVKISQLDRELTESKLDRIRLTDRVVELKLEVQKLKDNACQSPSLCLELRKTIDANTIKIINLEKDNARRQGERGILKLLWFGLGGALSLIASNWKSLFHRDP